MKPHIYKYAGIWYCRTLGDSLRTVVEGLGYNPRHAYEDWKHTRNRMKCAGIRPC